MKKLRRTLVALLSCASIANLVSPARACGPSTIDPIFVFKESPDLPFTPYVHGNLGIVQPTFGRKTLFIAYRYLNGGWFSDDEQTALIDALNGTAPEDDGVKPLKAWLAARKEVLPEEEALPEVYLERRYGGYDFFPNCSGNAFAVATETLHDHIARYGAEDLNVRAWLAAQDRVFQNCRSGSTLPEEAGPATPVWLRKDRDYQIAAALFYSLNFDEARARFEKIATDSDSPWQQTAEYLIDRTLVRQASLTVDEKLKRELYGQAERHLQISTQQSGQFADADRRMLALVKYRLHPEERVHELADALSHQSGNSDLKQNLIDYVWLLDKFEDQILKAEEQRKKNAKAETEKHIETNISPEEQERQKQVQAVARGELIAITFSPKLSDGKLDPSQYHTRYFKPGTTPAEIVQQFALLLGRPLLPEEQAEVNQMCEMAEEQRQDILRPNRKFDRSEMALHDGCDYLGCDRLSLELLPPFLSIDDLSDWIFTVQTSDVAAYEHAFAKWQDNRSDAWLIAALTKAQTSSPQLPKLLQAAEKIDANSKAFPSVAYHLARLRLDQRQPAAARKILDQVLSTGFAELPISARNQFLAERAQLADNVNDFLRFAQRKPVVFDDEGTLGTMHDLIRNAKARWDPQYYSETKEEYDARIDTEFQQLLPWDDQFVLDDRALDALNWHFPLSELERAAHNPVMPEYLRRRLILAVWTRAIVLENREVAARISQEVMKIAPEMAPVFSSYLDAANENERKRAALFVLLKFPSLSPMVAGGIPLFQSSEQTEYYFETSWWCTPETTEYSVKESREVPKVVPRPPFLSQLELDTAARERKALIAIGDGKSYLGKRVIEWARSAPADSRIPEALFIAAEANKSYKYGCNGWENDEETEQAAAGLLLTRYPQSSWAARLRESEVP